MKARVNPKSTSNQSSKPCTVLQYPSKKYVAICCSVLQSVAECCRVLQSVAECCSVLKCAAVWCSMLHSVAVCCSVLQRVAVYCSALVPHWICCKTCCAVIYIYLHTYVHWVARWDLKISTSKFLKLSSKVIVHSKLRSARNFEKFCRRKAFALILSHARKFFKNQFATTFNV